MTSKPHLPDSKELDHILPINQGGTHTHGNVRIVCRRCNQTRPKDGTDYAGQLTLWAQDSGAPVGRLRTTCRKGLHPWVPENIEMAGKGKKRCRLCRIEWEVARNRRGPLRHCACGALFPAPGRTPMCPDCTVSTGHRAAELHASGLSWPEVARQTGYGSAEGARHAAKRTGYVPGPRPPRLPMPKPLKLCGCGAPIPPGIRGKYRSTCCDDCVRVTAQRAVELRRAGHTLGYIASELGYGSKSTVTNLMVRWGPLSRPGRQTISRAA